MPSSGWYPNRGVSEENYVSFRGARKAGWRKLATSYDGLKVKAKELV